MVVLTRRGKAEQDSSESTLARQQTIWMVESGALLSRQRLNREAKWYHFHDPSLSAANGRRPSTSEEMRLTPRRVVPLQCTGQWCDGINSQ
jgi:hypothetical protein